MDALGITISPTKRKMGKVDLTTQQYSDYKKFINEEATKRLNRVLPALERMPNKKLAEIIAEKQVMRGARKVAQMRLYKQYPDLRRAIMDETRYERFGE